MSDSNTRLVLVEEHIKRIDTAVEKLVAHRIELDKALVKDRLLDEKIREELKLLNANLTDIKTSFNKKFYVVLGVALTASGVQHLPGLLQFFKVLL